MFEKWIKNPSTANQKKYEAIKNKVSALIKDAKKETYRKIGKDPSAKSIYKKTKAIMCNQESSSPVIEPDFRNEFLVANGPLLSSKRPVDDTNINLPRVSKTMFQQPTVQWKVATYSKQMKNKKTYGLDGSSNEILKCCSPIIRPVLATAFNKCIEERTFPKWLKIAKVIPLFKKGDESKPENYLQIKLLSSIISSRRYI